MIAIRFLVLALAVVTGLATLRPGAARAQSEADFAGHLRVMQAEEEAKSDPAKKKEIQEGLAKAEQKLKKEAAAQLKTDDAFQAHHRFEWMREVSKFRIRRSYADLLSLEFGGDPSASQTGTLKDVKGALFSYTDNFQNDSDSWTAQAAIIWPFIFKTGFSPEGQFGIPIFGIMPSFTINRFTTSKKPKDAIDLAKIKESETDEMVYRLGSFAHLYFTDNLFAVVRANGVWTTDTGSQYREPGVELEFEPLWQSTQCPSLGLGFIGVPDWAKKEGYDQAPENYKQHSWFAYQARLRGRFIWGSVRDNGEGKRGPDYTRAGVTFELHVEPFIFEKLSASVIGSYLPALSGDIAQDRYFEVGLGYTIHEDKSTGSKVSVEAKYLWGAQDNFGKKEQDQFTVALAVLY